MSRTAVITGGSGGIGRACVRELAPEMNVLIQYHSNEAPAAELAEYVRSDLGGEAAICRCDVSVYEEVTSLIDHAIDVFGDVDVLVNGAGVLLEKPVSEMTPEHIERVVSINLVGTMYCTQAVLPQMIERGTGWIVNLSSTAGTRGSSTGPAYSAAKGGVIGFSKSVARRYSSDGILTNVVAPSAVDTQMYPAERRETAAESFPQGRLIQPEEVAGAVHFLANASYISGKVLEVDGGRYT